MPNILAGRKIVPEFLQDRVKPDTLAGALLGWLDEPDEVARYRLSCTEMHLQLRRDAATRSADAVLSVTGVDPEICASARVE
jgi:lipid-A-disaccharide synthase